MGKDPKKGVELETLNQKQHCLTDVVFKVKKKLVIRFTLAIV
jgi:hypothetical protein